MVTTWSFVFENLLQRKLKAGAAQARCERENHSPNSHVNILGWKNRKSFHFFSVDSIEKQILFDRVWASHERHRTSSCALDSWRAVSLEHKDEH
jgi:hypothetical protein